MNEGVPPVGPELRQFGGRERFAREDPEDPRGR